MALGSSLSHQAIILGRRKACNQRGGFPRVQAQIYCYMTLGKKTKSAVRSDLLEKTKRYKYFVGKPQVIF